MAATASAKKKRRGDSSRGKSRKKNTSKKKPVAKKKAVAKQPLTQSQWFLELLAIGSTVLALILALCILSVKFRVLYPDVVLFQKNILGPVGKLVGTLATGFLGWVALLPAIGLLVVALHLWFLVKDERELSIQLSSRWLAFIGLVGTLLSSCALVHTFFGRGSAGTVGNMVGEPLVLLFNTTGASIISGAVFLISFAFATQNNTVDILTALFLAARTAVKFLFWSLPRLVFFAFVDILFLTYSLISMGFSWLRMQLAALFSREVADDDDILDELPQPKRRKNRVPEVEPEPEEEFTHVVVKRRSLNAKASKKLLVKAKKKQKEQIQEFVQVGFPPYTPPDSSLLTAGESGVSGEDDDTLRAKSRMIEGKLKDFGILGRVTHVHPGPVITLFEFEPAAGVKVGRIASLQDDLAMSLRALSIRIIAPIPQRGTVGIEVPNTQRDLVRLRDCLESEAFVSATSSLSVPIGKDTYGEPVAANIANMPHLLVAGATGTGKSVFINSLLVSLLYRSSPAELGLILIDPKILELSVYDGIPHLRVPVVTVPRQARAVLDWAVQEMERRYRLLHRFGVRSIDGYNEIARGEEPTDGGTLTPLPEDVVELTDDQILAEGTADTALLEDEAGGEAPDLRGVEVLQPLPKIVIVIDELADLMLTVGRDIEELITRLAQKARAAGIHLIVATQRPSVDVITGLIKANFPARISFRVSSRIDSRTILDNMGAERLLGNGDLLFMRPGAQHVHRIHGAFVSDREVLRVVAEVKKHAKPQYDPAIIAACEKALEEESSSSSDSGGDGDEGYDDLYDKAVELVVDKGKASTSMVQRAFRIGYNRAARIIETMERDGVIGPMDGAKPRQVLVGAIGGDEAELE